MKPHLHPLRKTTSFSACWHLVPWAISGATLVAACAVQVLIGDGTTADNLVMEVEPARPALAASDGS